MKRSSSDPALDPGFAVQITRGQRTVDAELPLAPAQGSLTAGRRARNVQQRVLAGLLVAALAVVGLAFAISWWSAQPPPGVLARVNGENITVNEVDREILLNRAMTALLQGKEETASRSAMVDSIISRRMKAQDATNAKVTVSAADVEAFVADLLARNNMTLADLDTALKGYGVTRQDLYAEWRDVVQINRYIGLYVAAGATTDDERLRKQNDWEAQLQRTSKVEHFGVPDEPTAPKVGATAPDFKLRDLSAKIQTLSDLHGRPVLINFWATWCEPCRTELPTIQATYAKTRGAGAQPGPGLEVLGVAVESDPSIVTSFKTEYGLGFPVLPDEAGQIKDLYRVGPIPTSFFLDRQGIIRGVHVGILTDKDLTDNLKLVP